MNYMRSIPVLYVQYYTYVNYPRPQLVTESHLFCSLGCRSQSPHNSPDAGGGADYDWPDGAVCELCHAKLPEPGHIDYPPKTTKPKRNRQ